MAFRDKTSAEKEEVCPSQEAEVEEAMPENSSQPTYMPKRYPWEFWLVVGMLVALLILLCVLLSQSLPSPNAELVKLMTEEGKKMVTMKDITDYNDRMLAHRKDVLSIIITAFGAWVGAGAAYFFGRENLQVAANSLLAMRDLSPKDRLRRTSIKQIPPTPIDWTVKKATKLSEVKDALIQKPERWFIPVVKDDGTLETVVNEEAVWRYLNDKLPAADASDNVKKSFTDATIDDLLKYIDSTEALKRFDKIHAVVAMETNVAAATELMDSRHVFLAIVAAEGKPTHFFTTSEVRKLLLQE